MGADYDGAGCHSLRYVSACRDNRKYASAQVALVDVADALAVRTASQPSTRASRALDMASHFLKTEKSVMKCPSPGWNPWWNRAPIKPLTRPL